MSAPVFAGSLVTRPDIGVFIPNVWAFEILRYRDRKFHMANLCKTINVIGKKGEEVYFPKVGRLTTRDRIPNQPVTLQRMSGGSWKMKVTKDKEVSFGIDKIVNIQSQYDLRKEYTMAAGEAMARDLDNFLLGMRAVIPTTNRIFRTTGAGADTAAGDPAPLDNATILAAMQMILDQDGDLSQCKWLMSPNQVMDLMDLDKFVSNDYNLAQLSMGGFKSGMIGTLYGLPVYVSTQISNNSLTGYIPADGAPGEPTPGVEGSYYLPDQEDPGTIITTLPRGKTGNEVAQPFHSGLLVHPDWCMLAKQQNVATESDRVIMYQADVVVSTHIYGAKSFYPELSVMFHTRGN